jgi:hypothetical protein
VAVCSSISPRSYHHIFCSKPPGLNDDAPTVFAARRIVDADAPTSMVALSKQVSAGATPPCSVRSDLRSSAHSVRAEPLDDVEKKSPMLISASEMKRSPQSVSLGSLSSTESSCGPSPFLSPHDTIHASHMSCGTDRHTKANPNQAAHNRQYGRVNPVSCSDEPPGCYSRRFSWQ